MVESTAQSVGTLKRESGEVGRHGMSAYLHVNLTLDQQIDELRLKVFQGTRQRLFKRKAEAG